MSIRGKYQTVNLNNIVVYDKNPRIFEAESENEAIINIMYDNEDKIYNLADSILQNGLSPLDIIGVFKEGNKYIAQEGNRRITAIKIMKNPSLIKSEYPKHYAKFNKLTEDINLSFLDNVYVYIVDSKKDLDYWMENKHLGENQGRGMVRWSTEQIERHKQNTGKPTRTKDFLDNLIAKKIITSQEAFDDMNYTFWQRILGTIGRRELGISLKNQKYSIADEELLKSKIHLVIDELKGSKVKRIYRNDDIQVFFDEINSKIEKNEPTPKKGTKNPPPDKGPNTDNPTSTPPKSPPGKNPTSDEEEQKPKKKLKVPRNRTSNRDNLIPYYITFHCDYTKINNIIDELKKLKLNDSPYSIAITFRTFIELSLRYLSENHPTYNFQDKNLAATLKDASRIIFGGEHNTKNNKKINSSISTAIKKDNNIDILNGLVHDMIIQVNRIVLVDFYNTLEPLFKHIYK
ncbi:hypothetical protein KHQ81_13060 [Mycoplasmatota bacterium]|nr:hypothetical protein KHQ81_13060 [Mycoplasmatota bacterium]